MNTESQRKQQSMFRECINWGEEALDESKNLMITWVIS